MRSPFRLLAVALAACMAISCSDATTSSSPSLLGGQVALAPTFSPSAARAYSALSAFGIEVTTVHITLVAPDGSIQEKTFAFPVGTDTLEVELGVPARSAGQTFRADLQLLSADGQVLFSGSQTVVAQASNLPSGVGSPAVVQIDYTGPGSAAKSVVVTPGSASLTGAATLPVTASALDASGNPVNNVLVRWTTSDASLVAVAATGNSSAAVTSTGKRGTATISAITPLGITGIAQITVSPVASKLVVISGGGQTGVSGVALAQPFVVEVQASDNLPVPGAAVTFRSVTTGGIVGSASASSGTDGRASTTMTLGPTAGAYVFEASSTNLAPVTVNATATASPATNIDIVSGNFQGGRVGTSLAQPLKVKVTDRFGAPVAGVTVNWAAAPGAGSVGAATSVTAADGTAISSYTLGTSAKSAESVRASLPGVSGSAGEVFFTVVVIPGAPAEISVFSGNAQHGNGGAQLANALVAHVTDQYGNPLQDFGVTWSLGPNSAGRATFSPVTSVTNAAGNASTTVTLGNTVGAFTIIASINGLTASFDATIDQGGAGSTPGILSGQVYNAVSGAPLAAATVSITGTGGSTTLSTASDGRYTTSAAIPAGTYDIAISTTGFVSTTIVGQIVNGNTVAEAVPLVPASGSPGSISGAIIDATNNQLVSGATVQLRSGMNNTTGTIIQTTTTSGNGQYSFTNVAAGTYTVLATANGFANAFKTGISVGANTNTANQNVFVSPAGASGQVRVVLTWRSTPRDLDSHLTGPTSGGSRFHVWYAGAGNCGSAPFACLDNDVTSGSGPETITISQVIAGTYRYSVQNYSAAGNGSNPNDLSLSNSGGRVDVYMGNVLAQTFAVPAGAGSLWTVFELSGTTITPVNQISAGPVLLPSRIPLSGASSSAAVRRTDATTIFNDIAAHPKAARPQQ